MAKKGLDSTCTSIQALGRTCHTGQSRKGNLAPDRHQKPLTGFLDYNPGHAAYAPVL